MNNRRLIYQLIIIGIIAFISADGPQTAFANTVEYEREQLQNEIKQLKLDKEILERKLQEVQEILDLDDPSKPNTEYTDRVAQKTLKQMARATERFAKANEGVYPNEMEQLTNIFPPFIKDNFCNQEQSGFRFSCYMTREGFKYTATPITIGTTGSKVFSVTTGGKLFNK